MLVEVSAGAGAAERQSAGAAERQSGEARASSGVDPVRPGLAAFTTGPPGSERSSWVVLNAPVFSRLSEPGRRVVLTHEVTHVLTRTATAPDTPAWLSEGFADYVAYRDAGVPVHQAARGLLDRVRRGEVPSSLPSAGDFSDRAELDDSRPSGDEAYQAAWLACRTVADRYGEARLVALYRAYGQHYRGGALPPADGDGIVRSVLGLSEDELVAQWRSDLRREAR